MSEKNERLINLAIALIAAKRPITKDQIFKTVAGYSGNNDAMDRMFERDKESLKSLGIDITVAPIDSYFDDEVGYKITESDYTITLGELSPKEIGFLTVAAKIWEETSIAENTRTVVRRLHSLGVAAELEVVSPNKRFDSLSKIMTAIYENKSVSFSYRNEKNESENRHFAPLAITGNQGIWYLHGLDLAINEIRTFRLDRIDSEISILDEVVKRPSKFEIPVYKPSQITAKLRIRRDTARSLRFKASELIDDGDWEIASITFESIDSLIRESLWHANNVKIIEPSEARNRLLAALDEVIAIHG